MTQTTFSDKVLVQGSQDTPQLQVEGNATQTQPLQNWLDSSNNVKAQVTGDGRVQIGNNLGVGAPADSLLQLNQDVTLPSSLPTSSTHTLGRLTGALSSAVSWVVHELQLLGTGGVSGLQTAVRAKLTLSNTGTSTSAELRAGDFQTINQGGASGSAVGQATGLRATASNSASAYLAKAVGVEAALTNDTGGNITQATAFNVVPPTNAGTIGTLYGLQVPDLTQGGTNYAIYTGQGPTHFGDNLEVKVQSSTPAGSAPSGFVKLYPKLSSGTPHLYAKDSGGTEYDLSNSGAGSVTSVGLSMPSEFAVSGSPVTSTGTLSVSKATQNANQVYAGPTSGGAAQPAFRALVAADIPSLDSSKITTGTLAQAQTDYSPTVILAPGTSTRNVVQPTGNYKALIIKGNAAQTNNLLEAQNSGGTALMAVTASGKVGIGTSTPSQFLDVTYGHLNFTTLTAPSAPTVAVNATSGNLNGNYTYKVTFVTASGETDLSSQSASVSPANQQVNVTLPLGLSGVVTQRKIYRTNAGGFQWFYVATVSDNTTTLYTDNIADASLGANYTYKSNTTAGSFYLNNTLAGQSSFSLTSFGLNALGSNSGNYNVAVGSSALGANTTGIQNSAVGFFSLAANSTGFNNTAVGYNALNANTTAYDNTAVGSWTLPLNTTGTENVAVGSGALRFNSTGNSNTALGSSTLADNTTGGNNTAVGQNALSVNTTGASNTAVGQSSLSSNTGSNNTAVGQYTLVPNTTGSNNTVLGFQAGVTATYANGNTTGSNNTFLGYNSGPGTATQLSNATALGANALVSASNALVLGGTGANAVNVGVGTATPGQLFDLTYGHLRFTPLAAPSAPTVAVSGTAGVLNGNYSYKITFVTASGETDLSVASSTVSPASKQVNVTLPLGSSGTVTQRKIYRTKAGGTAYFYLATVADNTTTSYTDNTADGSLVSDYSYSSNSTSAKIFVGTTQAGFLGNYNTAFGLGTLAANTSGTFNTAIGAFTLWSNTTGTYNTAHGEGALQYNTTGTGHTAMGQGVLASNTTGSYNTAHGASALLSNTTGSNNTALGFLAGYTATPANANTTGSNNTFIGYNSGPGTSTQLTNATALGYNALVSASSALVLGGTGSDAISVGIGVTAPNSVLQVAGPIATAVASKTASYTITATDSTILADTTSASVTITLPTAVGCTGRRYTVKRISAGANSCTVGTTSSQTIDGAATKSLASQWTTVTVISNGTNWLTV